MSESNHLVYEELSLDTDSISDIESLELTSFIQSFLRNLPEPASIDQETPLQTNLTPPQAFSDTKTFPKPLKEDHSENNKTIKPSQKLKFDQWRLSEVLTSAKDSFVDEAKGGIHQSSFAIPNKMHCNSCNVEVYTSVTFQSSFPSFWDNLFRRFKCCNSPNSAKQSLVHLCSKCQKVLIRIYPE